MKSWRSKSTLTPEECERRRSELLRQLAAVESPSVPEPPAAPRPGRPPRTSRRHVPRPRRSPRNVPGPGAGRPPVAADLVPSVPGTFVTPASPDVRPILLTHRKHDGYVSFHRKRGEQFENLCSVPANMLEGLWEQFAGELEEDSFFSIMGFYRGARSPSRSFDNNGNALPTAGGPVARYDG